MKAAVGLLLAAACGGNSASPDASVNNTGLDGSIDSPMFDAPYAALASTKTVLSFGTVLIDARSAGIVTSISNQAGPSVITSLTLSGTGAAAYVIDSDACTGVTLAGSTTCDAQLRFAPTVVGSADATLAVTGSASGSVGITLKGDGALTGALAFTPSAGAFNDVTTNTTSSVGLQLQNVGANPTGAITIELSGPDVGLFQVTADNCDGGLAASGTCSLTVTFSPVNSGDCKATLSASDAVGGTMTADLTGTGI